MDELLDDATVETAELTDNGSIAEDDDEWESRDSFIPAPETKHEVNPDLIPCSVLLARAISNVVSMRL